MPPAGFARPAFGQPALPVGEGGPSRTPCRVLLSSSRRDDIRSALVLKSLGRWSRSDRRSRKPDSMQAAGFARSAFGQPALPVGEANPRAPREGSRLLLSHPPVKRAKILDSRSSVIDFFLVREEGLEPSRVSPRDPKSRASAGSATLAWRTHRSDNPLRTQGEALGAEHRGRAFTRLRFEFSEKMGC